MRSGSKHVTLRAACQGSVLGALLCYGEGSVFGAALISEASL